MTPRQNKANGPKIGAAMAILPQRAGSMDMFAPRFRPSFHGNILLRVGKLESLDNDRKHSDPLECLVFHLQA